MGSFIRQVSFGGGEIGPPWWARSDIDRYKTAARTLKNYIVTKSGSLLNRPGTKRIATAISSVAGEKSWLEQFYFSGDQTYVLEFGKNLLKVYDAQAVVSSLAVPGSLVAADGTNNIRRSTDGGASWTSVALPSAGVAHAVAYNGSNRWMAVGVNYAAFSTDDGASWTAATTPATMTKRAVVFISGTTWVAVGDAGKFTRSTDNGVTWSAAGTTSTAADWKHAAYGNSQVVLTGWYGAGLAVYAACSADSGATYATVTNVSGSLGAGYTGTPSQPVWTASRWIFGYLAAKYSSPLWITAQYSAVATTGTGAYTVTGLAAVAAPTVGYGNAQAVWNGTTGYFFCPIAGGSSTEYTFTATGTFTQESTGRKVSRAWLNSTTAMYQDVNLDIYSRSGTTWVLVGTGPSALSGAWVSSYSTVSSIATPYGTADLPYLRMVQSGDTIYIFRRGYATYKLVRSSLGGLPSFSFSLAAPTPTAALVGAPVRSGAIAAADAQHPNVEWRWAVVWVADDGTESPLGASLTEAASQCYPDRPAVITWTGISGAAEYYIFRGRGGTWGYVGSVKAENGTGTESFTDEGQVPDLSIVPRTYDDVLGADAPCLGAFFQDRLMVANSSAQPNTVRGSATGDYLNFDKVKFQRDDSPLELTANSRRYEEVRALVSLRELLVLTSESEASLSGAGSDPLTFHSLDYKTHSKRGCAWVEPVVVGDVCIYVQRDGSAIRDLVYNVNSDSYQTNELTMFVDHLLAGSGRTVVDIAYCQHPWSIVWVVLSDGKVISLSYLPELKQIAWTQHDFSGTVESVCSVYDGVEDVPWFVVVRDSVRQLERMTTRRVTSLVSMVGTFLDDAEYFTGAGTSVVTHFANGVVVYAVVDGVVRGPFTSNSGTVTIGAASGTLWVGRLITYDFESLDFPEALERKKVVSRAYVTITDTPALTASGGVIQAGEDLSHLNPATMASLEEGTVEILVDTTNNPGGRVAVRVASPIPIEIISISREVTVGQ